MPSGASTGIDEACELREGNRAAASAMCHQAAEVANTVLASALKGAGVSEQEALDAEMCVLNCTPDKDGLGANAILCVPLAAAKAAPEAKGMPCFDVMNDGSHSGNELAFQEYIIAPVSAEAPAFGDFSSSPARS